MWSYNVRFKTKPMAHQLKALKLMAGKRAFALLMEQGTGKTKVVIDDTAQWYADKVIDALLVLAPNGVHTKWVTIELPKHMPDWVPYHAAYYSAGASKTHLKTIEKLFEVQPENEVRKLRILTMNYEALATAEGKELLERFTTQFKAACAIDESQRIKNPDAKRTVELIKRRRRFPVRRIMSGTPITRAPFDAFAQYYFLDPEILRTHSYVAFKSEYAEMLDEDHYLVKKIRQGDRWKKKDGTLKKRVPQVIARDEAGMPQYRNLEKLQRLIAPHSFRVLKKDCLDLPAKIYDTIPFEMTPRQRQVYDQMEKLKRAEIAQFINELVAAGRQRGLSREQVLVESRELIVQNKLSAMAKLQQITCGYLKLEDGEVMRMFKHVMDNPRNQVMMESVEDAADGGIIFWAPHRDKIDQIIECLREGYDATQIVRYDGAVGKEQRMKNVDDFSEGRVRFFVGNPASGGTGLTLNYGKTSYYYSNSFNLEHRLQSEDRNHRIGQDRGVRYYDLSAIDTIDQLIAESNQMKKNIADIITGDAEL
jgi:SNF2 family DNA or RNA helicase